MHKEPPGFSNRLLRLLGVDPEFVSGAGTGHLGELARGAGGAFAVNAAGRLIAVLIHIFLARYLGVTGYGIYVTVLAGVNVAYVAANLGIDAAAVRFIPMYDAEGSPGLIRGFVTRSLLMVAGQALAAAVIAAAVIAAVGGGAGLETHLALWAAVALLPVKALLQLVASLLRAFKRVVQGLLLSTVLQPLAFAAAVLAAGNLAGREVDAPAALLINAATALLALGAGLVMVVRALPAPVRSARPAAATRRWIAVSLPMFLITAFQLILANTDVLMVGAISGTTESGIYRAASQVAIMVIFGLNCANLIMAPLISELHTRGDHIQLQRLVTASSRVVLIYSLTVTAGFILLGRPILALFSPEFTAGYPVLLLLSAAYFVISFTGPVGFLMTMTGFHREAAWIIGGAALLNVILNLVLIKLWGAVGAAAATGLVIALRSIALSAVVRKRLGIVSHPLGR